MADHPETQTNKQRLKEITDGIEQGIKDLFQSDRYRQYLSVMSRFHRYSVNNTMLIYMQRPDASLVAGFQKWKNQFGRHVKEGEHGITIIAPTPFKKKIEEVKLDPDTKAPLLDPDGQQIVEEKEISIPMFKPVKVFDVAQTYGKPLPHLVSSLTGTVEQYEVFVEALRRSAPVPISFKAIEPNTDGFFSPDHQAITIREGMSEVQTICAMVHEIAHSKLHNYEKQQTGAAAGKDGAEVVKKDRNTEEVEAESVSYAVCQYYGIQTGENSFGYIATWSQGKELKELRASLETINKTASGLITDIDRNFAEICKERGIDPKALPEQEQAAPDAYGLFATDLCDYLEQLSDAGKIDRPFRSMTREESADALAELMRNGSFDSARNELADAAEHSGERNDALLSRLEALSDKWDLRLSYRIEPNVLRPTESMVLAVEPRADGPKEHGVLFAGPTQVCEKLLTELRDGSMTVRQARALHQQWQDAGYEAPPGEPETLSLMDNAQILHIQATEEGFDYTLYDADSMQLIDGGQFSMEGAKMHPAKTLMDGAFKEVCVLQGIEPAKVETLPLEKLGEISQTDALPMEPELQQDTPEKSALPDPTITPHMMERYGYTDQDMLPLSKDRALELAARDVTIYLLYRDGNEEMAFDAEEIMQHDGIFGVSRDEWEAIREDVPPRDIEQRFQNNPNDAFVIYQLNESVSRDRLFVEYARLDSPPQRDHYDPIYTGDLQYAESTAETLEELFQSFNIHRPGDFCGHSLSVSDIVAIKQDGAVSYHYCDSVGFREPPGFNQPDNYLKSAEMAVEDDFGMIDGIINNGPKQPTVAELEAQVNAGQTISLLDLANAIQAEKKAAPRAKEERLSIMDRLKQPLPKQTNKTAPHRSAEREI